MPKERNKADCYREKAPIKREKSDVFIDSSEREVSRPKVKAYEGDTKAMNRMLAPMAYAASPINGNAQRYELAANGGDAQAQFATGWFLMTGTGVPWRAAYCHRVFHRRTGADDNYHRHSLGKDAFPVGKAGPVTIRNGSRIAHEQRRET